MTDTQSAEPDETVNDALVDITNVVAEYNQQPGTDGAHAALMRIGEIVDRVFE